MPIFAQPLRELRELQKMDNRHLAVRAKNKMPNVGSLCNGWATIGISLPSLRDVPRDFVRYATVREVEAESWQNPLYLENQNLHRWMCYSMDCSFETANF
jgi:hypothetical protein